MAIFRGRFGKGGALRALAVAAREGPGGPTPPRTIDLLLDGLVTLIIDGYEVGFSTLRRALRACEEDQGGEGFEWLWYTSVMAPEVWDRRGVGIGSPPTSSSWLGARACSSRNQTRSTPGPAVTSTKENSRLRPR